MKRPLSLDVLRALLTAVVFALFARTFVVQAFEIPSSSMEPGLLAGDHILVNKFIFTPWGPEPVRLLPSRRVARGDVVVFRFPRDPDRDFVKRCVALPGDIVEIDDKRLFLSGEPVDESAYAVFRDPRTYPRTLLLPEAFHRRDNFGPTTVRDGELFCLGDNRDRSNDSRFWGGVPRTYVKGRALAIYLSIEPLPPLEAGGPLGLLREAFRNTRTLPQRIRWGRSLQLVR